MSDGAVLHQPAEHVHPKCRPWWTTQILITTLIVIAVPVLLAILISPIRTLMLILAGAVAIVGIVLSLVVPGYLMRTHRWEVNDIGIYSQRGWLWQEWRGVPFARLQTVDVTSGPVQRAFGLATVTATTASAKGPVLIEAIDTSTANQLAERLTALAQGDSQGNPQDDGT